MTLEMSSSFERLFSSIESRVSPSSNINALEKKIDMLTKELNNICYSKPGNPKPLAKNTSFKSDKNSKNAVISDKPMTLNEKKALGQNIRKLPPEYLRGVWEIVCDGTELAQEKDELEFDIETLPVRKVRELERYVKNKLKAVAKNNQRRLKKAASMVEEVKINYFMIKIIELYIIHNFKIK